MGVEGCTKCIKYLLFVFNFVFWVSSHWELGTGEQSAVRVGSAQGPIERAQRGIEVAAPPVGSVRRSGAWRPSPVGLGPGAELPGLCSRVFWAAELGVRWLVAFECWGPMQRSAG